MAGRMAARHGDRVRGRLRHALRQSVDALGARAAAGRRGASGSLFFPLYPQYSAPTTATANDQAFRALMRLRWQPALRTAPAYYDHPLYIEALARSVEAAYAGLDRRPDVLVTSYHGMPKRYLLEGDPYHCQCRATSRLLARPARPRRGRDAW